MQIVFKQLSRKATPVFSLFIKNIENSSKPGEEKKRLVTEEFERIVKTIRDMGVIINEFYTGREITANDLEHMLIILNNISEYLYEKYSRYTGKSIRREVKEMVTTFHIVEAEKRGEQKGKLEGRLEAARNMLAEGMDIPLIMKVTRLPEKEILRLKEEMGE